LANAVQLGVSPGWTPTAPPVREAMLAGIDSDGETDFFGHAPSTMISFPWASGILLDCVLLDTKLYLEIQKFFIISN